jgi:phosphate:Na+ symporter
VGLFLGSIITAIIQSSSATSVIVIGLVNAGLISFRNSLGVIFGANVGTTVTAQLVAFKLTAFAPYIIIAGFLLSLWKNKYGLLGKSLFYFGFVFFSLNLISSTVAPLQSNPRLVEFLTSSQNIFLSIAIGAVFTGIVQSSSVTTGLAVIFTQSGMLSLENAVPIVMGANIGTTTTAMLSMINMDSAARKTALSHLFFNVGGVLIFLPFISLLTEYFSSYSPEIALANIHLIFNLLASFLFLIFITPFSRLVEKCVKGGGHLDFPVIEFPKVDDSLSIDEAKRFLDREHWTLFNVIKETYDLVTLSLIKNDKIVYQAVQKRIAYFDYIQVEFTKFISNLMSRVEDEETSAEIMKYMNRFEYLNQVHDSLEDLAEVKAQIDEMYIELKPDALEHIKTVSDQMRATFESFSKSIHGEIGEDVEIKDQLFAVQLNLNKTNRALLKIVTNPERLDSGAFARFVTISYRLRDKLLNLRELFL